MIVSGNRREGHHGAMLVTLRQTAEMNSDRIISTLKSSSLNYEMHETPYSVRISFRKRFISDRSPQSPSSSTVLDTSTPPPSWSATTPLTGTPCAGCEEASSRIRRLEESNKDLFSANVKGEQQFQNLLAQSDALRKDLENQKLLKNESDSLVREARDKIHGHLDEITALKTRRGV